jgi:hypothetical protein
MPTKAIGCMKSSNYLLFNFRNSFYARLGLALLLGVGFASFFLLPFSISGDGNIRYEFMDTLTHQLRISAMRYSMIGPLFSLPLWLISLFSKNPTAIISRYNFLLFAALLFVLYQWLKGFFDQKFLVTFLFLLAFGSMFPAHLLNYYGEVFSAACLTLGSVGLAIKKERAGWIMLFLGVLNTPALLIPFALVVFYTTWEKKHIRYLLLIPTCIILMIAEAYIRTGNLMTGFQTYLSQDHGYETLLPYSGRTGYSYPFILGILSILLSFGKGLLFFCPGLLLIGFAWKFISVPIERKLMIFWLLIVLGLILAYASWWAWYGGWYWGPRFFLFASLPASWILARLIHSEQRSLVISLALAIFVSLSLWIGVNGVVFQQKTLDICAQNDYALEALCWYVPEFSPLIRPFITHATLSLKDRLILILCLVLWLYSILPLAIDLLQRTIETYKTYRPRMNFSSWRF